MRDRGLGGRVKGLNKKKYKEGKNHGHDGHGKQCEDSQGEGIDEVEEDIGEINDDVQTLNLGGEHTIQYTDGVLWNCESETCIILLASITPVNST